MRIFLFTDQDLGADPFPEDDWPCDPRPYLPEATWKVVKLDKARAVQQVIQASREGPDLVFNLCDGAWDEDRPGLEVVRTLERLGIPFTGATSAFFEPSREVMKRVCRAWDIDTPAYAMARDDGGLLRAAETLRFPLIVKHPSSYASTGLTPASRVETPGALLDQGRIMIAAYAGALVEEFIEGLECTVLVAENPDDPGAPVTFTPLQYRFPEGESFKHYELKWNDFLGLESGPVADPELGARLRSASARFFQGLGGAGYGRCDLRVDGQGRIFMLEINPNCGLYFPPHAPASADLILRLDPSGPEGFTRLVVNAALRRHQRRARPWEVRGTPDGSYGLFATRELGAGHTVLDLEGRPHRLVSLSHVEASWDEGRRAWFHCHAWPLTDEIWVLLSEDPGEWTPVRHSCDPSAWLAGLDVVARRPLSVGQEITLDYATFRSERMPSFKCGCGAAGCRGTVRGGEYDQPYMARYGDHVSDYVRRRRAERGRPGREAAD